MLQKTLKSLTHKIECDFERNANNFDFLRLLAALFVLIAHSPNILNFTSLEVDPIRSVFGVNMGRFGVYTFFIISGFLITRSWEQRNNLLSYSLSRILRIFPALIVVSLLSVFLLGPLLTSLSPIEYFSHTDTYRYLQNITLYRTSYSLPGVFETNPIGNSVNGSIWSLSYEFTCYLLIGFVGILKINNKWLTLLLFISGFTAMIFFSETLNTIIIPILGIDFKTFTPLLLLFLSGSLFYSFWKNIPINLIGLAISIICVFVFKDTVYELFALILFLPYIILCIAFIPVGLLSDFGRFGDFSYGIYLYAFPVQQTLAFFFKNDLSVVAMIILSVICTLPLAVISWYLIERPAIKLKKKIIGSYEFRAF